ncbi:PREDICTED: zinc finger MYM-type protein 1-like [Nicotiana attenuata]|uniref:zinc finger MYM-type protein 1-like n=1 Tax=Nicotiana attenuata TaxID=49451 RepID=UPI0009047506|nr:PREDICTED: zinc finger MYM-type protein 1-like [Nicotiana attenuata]
MNLLKFYNKVPKISSASQNVDQSEFSLHSSHRQEIDTIAPQSDPAERTPILEYHPNHRDEIRRAYIQGGACQPRYHDFSQSHFSGFMRRFNPLWFDEFNWLDYSSIIAAFDKQSDQTKLECWLRLNASVDVVRILLTQGFAFHGHDESETSLNKGNFIEILSWYAAKCDKIEPFVLKHAPKNNKMTSSDIQKEIVTACKIETIKAIIEDLNGDYFALLVDESLDVSRKEQMAIVLRYVDKRGSVMERFIGMVHVRDTSALSLKKVIVDVLVHHSLSLSSIRGQCYDGASNMQVAVSKKCVQVGELVLLVSNILNVLGASFKRVDEFRDSQKEKLQEALDMGELKTGRGLNQELGLVRAGDTRWGSHYKSFGNFIRMFGSIADVLDTLVEDAGTLDDRAKASGYLGITNKLNISLQKKEQDIANAMLLVQVAKKRLQTLRRDDEWDLFVDKVSMFCIKHDILVPNFDGLYVNFGRSRRKPADYTFFYHYRVDVFCKVLDWQVQELNDRFDKVTTELLHGVACLNPIDAFSSFDIRKIMKMDELYPNDFDEFRMSSLENQLASYIIDVRDFDERFSNLNGLSDLSKRLVKTKKHSVYPLVFLLVKLVLLLPVATATVERAFSAMKFIKNDLRNRMDDDFLGGCIVPYVEREVFSIVSNESIIKTFQEMKPHRVRL